MPSRRSGVGNVEDGHEGVRPLFDMIRSSVERENSSSRLEVGVGPRSLPAAHTARCGYGRHETARRSRGLGEAGGVDTDCMATRIHREQQVLRQPSALPRLIVYPTRMHIDSGGYAKRREGNARRVPAAAVGFVPPANVVVRM